MGFWRASSCFSICLGLFVACGGDDFDSGPEPLCPPDEASCNGQCVSASDPALGCGSCSPCALENAVPTCEAGACVVKSCQSGFADCDQKAGCEASLNSIEHCGQCDKACASGDVCDQGTCSASCPTTKTQCGSSCVDTQTDVLHCGACDTPCQTVANALSVCTLGVCGLACNPGFLNCDGKRETGCEINSSFDPNHCGACGNPCKAGELCNGGECKLSCGGGTTECDGKCVALATDEANCGDCGKACAAGQTCSGGMCQLNCGIGTTECNGVCVDTKLDPNNCGACGKVCAVGHQCVASACVPKCTTQVPTDIFVEEFADNSKNWGLDSPWGIKAALASSGDEYGFPDPAFDNSPTANDGVAGVVIGGNVPVSVHGYKYLTSPVIDVSAASSLFLTYSRWLNSDYEPFMKNVVQVFNGTQWITIWESGTSPGITDDLWVKQSFEITPHKSTKLQIRFGYTIYSDSAFIISGWNVDDVKLTTVTCL